MSAFHLSFSTLPPAQPLPFSNLNTSSSISSIAAAPRSLYWMKTTLPITASSSLIWRYTDEPFGQPFPTRFTIVLHISHTRVFCSRCVPLQHPTTHPVTAWSPAPLLRAPRLPSLQARGRTADLSVLLLSMLRSSSTKVRRNVTSIATESLQPK